MQQDQVGAGARKGLAARQNAVMVKRIAPMRVVCFCLLAACGALCQSGRTVDRGHHRLQLQAARVQRQQIKAAQSLPDAPSAQVLNQADPFQKISEQSRLSLLVGPAAVNTGVVHETHVGIVLPEAPSATMLYKAVPDNKGADAFWSRYLNPSSRNQNSRYQPSSRDRVMGRATDAASRILVTRDASGKRRLNAPYFLRVLTSVAADSASRRYRARSGAAPLTDFGSTVGNDAGMNLLHEFGPGIRQKVAGHLPEFVSRIEQHLIREPNPRSADSIAAR